MDNIGDSAAIRLVKRKGGELCCVTTFLFPSRTLECLVPNFSHTPPFDHLAQICRYRGCATDFPRLSKHELAFTSLCSCQLPYLTLPYLSQGWAKIHRSHSHSTPHPGAQRQSSSRLALSASQNCNLSTNPLPVSHADCQSNLFSTSSDHWNRVNRIYNCRAGRTLPLICRCLHRVNRVHHCRHHFPLDPALVVLTIFTHATFRNILCDHHTGKLLVHISTWPQPSSGLCCRYSLVRKLSWSSPFAQDIYLGVKSPSRTK